MTRPAVGPYRAHARDLGAPRLSVLCFAGGAPRFSWGMLVALGIVAVTFIGLAVLGSGSFGRASGPAALVVSMLMVAVGALVTLVERARLLRSDAQGVTVRGVFESWRVYAADAAGSRLSLSTEAGTMSLGVPSIRPGDEHEVVVSVTTAVRAQLSPPPMDAVASLPRPNARALAAVPSQPWAWAVATGVAAIWLTAFLATDDGSRGAWFSLGVPLHESALLAGAPLQRFPGPEALSALWLVSGAAGSFAVVGTLLSGVARVPPPLGEAPLRMVVIETGPRGAPGRRPMIGVLRGSALLCLVGLPMLGLVNFLVRDGSMGALTPILYVLLPANLVLLPFLAGWFMMEVIRGVAAARVIELDAAGVWLRVDGDKLRLTDVGCDGPVVALRAGDLVVHVRLPALMHADGLGELSHEAELRGLVQFLLTRMGAVASI